MLQGILEADKGIGPSESVIGGSGVAYPTITAALAAETSQTISGVVPQGGTTAGVVVFTGSQSSVDDFYKDWYVLNTDTTPSNGLVCQWARISGYTGSTRTAVIDKPWNFSAESTVSIIQPSRITLEVDIVESPTITVPCEINLQGHRLQGQLNITGGNFCAIRGGSGVITDGVEKTDLGVLRMDDTTVSRRGSTIYALLMTQGSDLGRCELTGCRFDGRVSGRRGQSGWKITDCTNYGVPSNSASDVIAYALVESVPGVSVALSQFDADIDSELGGCFFYSENDITGTTAYISIFADITAPASYVDPDPPTRTFFVVKARGAGTINVTGTSGRISISLKAFGSISNLTQSEPFCGIVNVLSYTGSCTFSLTVPAFMATSDSTSTMVAALIDGSSDTSGAVTVGGNWTFSGPNTVQVVRLNGRLTGSVTVSATGTVRDASLTMILLIASQNSGTPTVTVSGTWIQTWGELGAIYSTDTVSTGTWTVSGNIFFNFGRASSLVNLPSSVSGGTWNITGTVACLFASGSATSVNLFVMSASAATVTVSGRISVTKADVPGSTAFAFLLAIGSGTGGTMTLSGLITIFLGALGAGNPLISRTTTSGPTVGVTGTVRCLYSYFESGQITFLNAGVAGGTVQGPTALEFDHCTFLGTVTTQSGSGTITWSNASLKYKNCTIDGLYTIVGDAFSSHEAFESVFNGNSSDESITASGTRPTTYRFWKCTFNGRYDDLLPEVIDDYAVRGAAGALSAGNLLTINSSGNAAAAGAGSVVEGICLDAVAASGDRTIMVRRGQIFVDSHATVVAGDSCVLDAAGTPTSQILGAAVVGQRTGRALEATGTTRSGEAYTVVNLM